MPRRSSRAVVGAALAAMTVSLATGCAGSTGSLPDEGPVAVYPRTDAGMDALLAGELRVEPDCVFVVAEDGTLAVPVFPAGDAEWDDGVLEYRDEDYEDGDAISLGGGFSPVTGAYIPDGCLEHQLFVVSPF